MQTAFTQKGHRQTQEAKSENLHGQSVIESTIDGKIEDEEEQRAGTRTWEPGRRTTASARVHAP